MVLRKIMGIFVITLMVGVASFASAGVPDLDACTASSAYTDAGQAMLFVSPDANGSAFDAAVSSGTAAVPYSPVDATVTVTVVDGLGAFVVLFPFEDLWLESQDGGLKFCPGGTVADASTDINGQTTWSTPLFAGGSSESPTEVMISGGAITTGNLPISYNSGDINGDGAVNTLDVVVFSGDFYGAYNFRSDLVYNGVVNLLDVVLLSGTFGASCPEIPN